MTILGSYIKYLGGWSEKEIETAVYSFLPKGRNLVYLDCGCDNGEKTLKRASFIGTKKVMGLESETQRGNITREKGINVFTSDLNKKWPLKTSSVDLITATEVIEHLVDLDNFFREAKRVLKKGGRIIISTENLAGYHNIFALLLGNQPYTGPYLSRIYPIGHRPYAKYYHLNMAMNPHVNVMTSKSLKQLLIFYGFNLFGFSGVGFYPFPPFMARVLSRLDKYHSSYIVVGAQK